MTPHAPPVELEDTLRLSRPDAGWSAAHSCDFDPSRAPGFMVRLDALEAFGRELAWRTSVSDKAVLSFSQMDKSGLAAEAIRSRRVERMLRYVLVRLMREPSAASRMLRGLDVSLVTRDREWRDILVALQHRSTAYDEHKKLALVKLRQYLLHRHDALDREWRERQSDPSGDRAGRDADLTRRRGAGDEARSSDVPGAHGALPALVRIPRGRAMEVDSAGVDRFDLRLAGHGFCVVQRDVVALVDENARRLPLREGRNLVGRALYNDVVIDWEFADVSRRHAIFDVSGARLETVTDLSSEGTYLPRERIRSEPPGG